MIENLNKPVRHVLVLRFKPGITAGQIGIFADHFREITTKIPGILGFEFGANNSPEALNRGMTHVALVTFESAQARDAYLPHPEHRRFVAADTWIIDEILVIDYSSEG
jgi:hypothetical protein